MGERRATTPRPPALRLRALRGAAAAEDGMALIMALGILFVLAIITGAVLYYSGSNARSADRSDADSRAFSIAEAGVSQGLSVLRASADALSPSALSTPRTVDVDSGSVTYAGSLSGNVWTITSTSTVANPTGPGAAPVSRTVTQTVEVRALVEGADPALWDRIFHNRTDKCLVIDTVTVPGSVTSRGDLCMRNGSRIARNTTATGETVVKVGDDVLIDDASSKIGLDSPSEPIQRAEVGGHCALGANPDHAPCSAADNIFATAIDSEASNLRKPQVDMDYWYEHAAPGPTNNCTTGSFPGGFDNDGSFNGSRATVEMTPRSTSYTCRVVQDGQQVGEISWDHLTGVLTVDGTIFVDGDLRFDDDGTRVNYRGRAILYAGDDVEFDELVCAGGTSNCFNSMSSWDPEQNMLIILSGGWSEYDQGADLGDQAGFQGVMYAREFCLIHQDFRSSGPILCDEVRIEENDEDQGGGWPSFYSWPELQSLVPGVLYGGSDTASSFELVLLEQSG